MSDLRNLYQEVILDHNRSPRNFGRLDDADLEADGHNPLCGDKLSITVKLTGDRVTDLRFEGSGCAISKASASLMTEGVKGRTLDDPAWALRAVPPAGHGSDGPGGRCRARKLAVFARGPRLPGRVKCAILAWHTLRGRGGRPPRGRFDRVGRDFGPPMTVRILGDSTSGNLQLQYVPDDEVAAGDAQTPRRRRMRRPRRAPPRRLPGPFCERAARPAPGRPRPHRAGSAEDPRAQAEADRGVVDRL